MIAGGVRMSKPEGIDISDNNGDNYNWAQWKGHLGFGMVKATESDNFHDPTFPRNWDAMLSIGIKRFAYHFARPGKSSPGAQADYFVAYVKKAGLGAHDHFVLDLEQNDGMKAIDVSFWAWAFRQEVFRLAPGHRCMVYTYPSFAEEGNCAKLGGSNLWVAEYGVPAPRMPVGPWKSAAFWQYTGAHLDRDRFMLGDETALANFCAT